MKAATQTKKTCLVTLVLTLRLRYGNSPPYITRQLWHLLLYFQLFYFPVATTKSGQKLGISSSD